MCDNETDNSRVSENKMFLLKQKCMYGLIILVFN